MTDAFHDCDRGSIWQGYYNFLYEVIETCAIKNKTQKAMHLPGLAERLEVLIQRQDIPEGVFFLTYQQKNPYALIAEILYDQNTRKEMLVSNLVGDARLWIGEGLLKKKLKKTIKYS